MKPCQAAPDMWYSETHIGTLTAEGKLAAAGCASCPLMHDCRERGRRNREPYGIWGGECTAERAAVLQTTVAELRGGSDPDKPTAQELANEMIEGRLTQREMGERYGVTYMTIYRWMKGADLTEPCEICAKRIKYNPLTRRPGAGVRSGILCPECRRRYGQSAAVPGKQSTAGQMYVARGIAKRAGAFEEAA